MTEAEALRVIEDAYRRASSEASALSSALAGTPLRLRGRSFLLGVLAVGPVHAVVYPNDEHALRLCVGEERRWVSRSGREAVFRLLVEPEWKRIEQVDAVAALRVLRRVQSVETWCSQRREGLRRAVERVDEERRSSPARRRAEASLVAEVAISTLR